MKRRFLILISLLTVSFFSIYFTASTDEKDYGNVKVLVLMPKYYGANTILLLDNIKKIGWEVTTCGISKSVEPCTWAAGLNMPVFTTDLETSEITDITQYDVLILPNASWRSSPKAIWNDVIENEHAMSLIKDAVDNNIVVYAACSAPRVLASGGLLNGVNMTGEVTFQKEFTDAGANYLGPNILPVIDKNIITSTRGMFYYNEIYEAVSTALEQTKSLRKKN